MVFSNCQEKNFPLEDLRTSSEHRNSNLEITFYCTEDAKLPSAPIYNKKVKYLPRKEPCGWNDLNNKNGHLDSLHGGEFNAAGDALNRRELRRVLEKL